MMIQEKLQTRIRAKENESRGNPGNQAEAKGLVTLDLGQSHGHLPCSPGKLLHHLSFRFSSALEVLNETL